MNFDGFLNGGFLDAIFKDCFEWYFALWKVYSDIFKSKVCISEISWNNKGLIIRYVVIQMFCLCT